MSTQGIVVGCDRKQEWLLPWWWEHYSSHNTYPVAFADFGMSPTALKWCQERGESLSLPPIHVLTEDAIASPQKKLLEHRFGKGIWFCRPAWFQKPFALLQAPFSQGLWIDLDCQINGSLEPLFHSLLLGAEIGLVKEPPFVQDYEEETGFLLPGEINYNSGVIAYTQKATILQQWAKEATENNGLHGGDQQALNRAIFTHRPVLIELPYQYNWTLILGPNPDALIYHYTGGQGKIEILKQVKPHLLPLIQQLIVLH